MIAQAAHVSELKKQTVEKLVQKIESSSIVAVLDMEGLPAKNLGAMRKKLRDKCDIVMAKKRLMDIAFDQSKKEGISELNEHMRGMPALLFTEENPFTLFKTLKKSQSKAPIKAGQQAPEDLIVPAGPTSFPPGPIIGELGQLGIKAGIDQGKVVIKQEAKLVKEGDTVNDKQAALLARLGMEPMRIGLSLVAVFENGEILTKSVLDIDEEAFMADLQGAAASAINVAYNTGYPVSEIMPMLLAKAHAQATTLADETGILTADNVGRMLAKAESQATALKGQVPEQAAKDDADESPSQEDPQGSSAPKEEAQEESQKEEPSQGESKKESESSESEDSGSDQTEA